MIEVSGFYYDGKSASRTEVKIRFYETGLLEIQTTEFNLQNSLKAARISPRIGNTCRNIYLPDGAKLETFANDELDVVAAYFCQNVYQALVHKLERHWHYVLAAVTLTAILLWTGIDYGVPLLAKSVAYSLPSKIEQDMGEEGLANLDEMFFEASALEIAVQQRIDRRFRQASAHLAAAEQYRLEFRTSKQFGANALALPGGIIIVTDDLVKLAENDEQIISVLGHEVGHVVHKHGLRSLLQNSVAALLMAGLLGDLNSIAGLAATLPTILLENRYSRKFELEADDYAIVFLKAQQIPPSVFATMLAHLQKTLPPETEEFGFLSTHPLTEERIQRINAAH